MAAAAGAWACGAALAGAFAVNFWAAFFAAACSLLALSSAPCLSSNFLTTGGSMPDEGAFTNSPRSLSIEMTSLLWTPYFLASSLTRTLATLFPPGPSHSLSGTADR